jgi:hypothetical protein
MPYFYKALPFNGVVKNLDESLLAVKLNLFIDSQASQGWEFYQFNSVQAYTNSGCFDALLAKLVPGSKGANMAKYDMIVFRKEMTHEELENTKARLQVEINNDTSKPRSDTHVKCPECKKLVRSAATLCRHCNCKLIPTT